MTTDDELVARARAQQAQPGYRCNLTLDEPGASGCVVLTDTIERLTRRVEELEALANNLRIDLFDAREGYTKADAQVVALKAVAEAAQTYTSADCNHWGVSEAYCPRCDAHQPMVDALAALGAAG